MSLPEEEETVEIPADVMVQCPLVKFALRPVSKCAECIKFGGLEDRFPGSPAAFAARYVLKCFGEPQRRPMLTLSKD